MAPSALVGKKAERATSAVRRLQLGCQCSGWCALMDRQILVFTSKRPLGWGGGGSQVASWLLVGRGAWQLRPAAQPHRREAERRRLERILRRQQDAAQKDAALRRRGPQSVSGWLPCRSAVVSNAPRTRSRAALSARTTTQTGYPEEAVRRSGSGGAGWTR